jgi:N-acetylglucosamine kinase-like BadF-type ATPase
MAVISEAAQKAIDQAGITRDQIRILYAGMTGADWPDEYEMLRGHILELGISPEVIVKNDSIIALRGGTEQPYGAILIAGSGANCAIRAPDGREYIYGYYHDDELQGSAALGRRALRAVYRAETGREPATMLTQIALDLFGCGSVDDLLRADTSDRLPWVEVRRLAPLLFKAANAGDVVAGQILRSFGEGMAELVVA